MALVQASLAEEILTRHERAVIRGIYRASQLSEGLLQLDKTVAMIKPEYNSQTGKVSEFTQTAQEIRLYLADQIVSALTSIKIPAAQVGKVSTTQVAKT